MPWLHQSLHHLCCRGNPRVELRGIRENQSRSLGISNDLCRNALSISPYQSAESSESDSSNSSGQCQHEMQPPMDLNLRIERESISTGRNDITGRNVIQAANDSTPEISRSEASAHSLRNAETHSSGGATC